MVGSRGDVDRFAVDHVATPVDQFDELRSLTNTLEEFNSMVWKAKKELGISLKSPISGIDMPEKLAPFTSTLTQMHNLE